MSAINRPLTEQVDLGPVRLDRNAHCLWRDGVKVALRYRAFRALEVLIAHRGRSVSQSKMLCEAWDGVQVSPHTVGVTVREIKNALGRYGSWISCRRGFGYSFDVPRGGDAIRTGQHFRSLYNQASLERAVECFEQAVHENPDDFQALKELASTYLHAIGGGQRPPWTLRDAFYEVHRRAVMLGGWTSELRIDHARALVMFERKLSEALAELLDVRASNDPPAAVHAHLSLVYAFLGDLDEALTAAIAATSSATFSEPVACIETMVRLFRREFDAALICARHALELHPSAPLAHIHYATALEFSGCPAGALKHYQLITALWDAPRIHACHAGCLARQGHSAKAEEIYQDLLRRRATEYVDASQMALLLEALGRRDEAFDELKRADHEMCALLPFVEGMPEAESMRQDPRFPSLRRRQSTCDWEPARATSA